MSLYGLAKGLIRLFGAPLWRLRAYGKKNVPMTGPLIVACNHSPISIRRCLARAVHAVSATWRKKNSSKFRCSGR